MISPSLFNNCTLLSHGKSSYNSIYQSRQHPFDFFDLFYVISYFYIIHSSYQHPFDFFDLFYIISYFYIIHFYYHIYDWIIICIDLIWSIQHQPNYYHVYILLYRFYSNYILATVYYIFLFFFKSNTNLTKINTIENIKTFFLCFIMIHRGNSFLLFLTVDAWGGAYPFR